MWKMDSNEIMLSRGGGGGNTNGTTGEGFIDRSKVRILLCDNDTKSSEEVFKLLCKCSYQVTSVRSPRQVIDALNAEGPDIDIILSEVDLPMPKGFKMLKHIMRDNALRRIPVIMMSAQDEVALVVKCLRLGAADYLVKPLRTNELLNLWTHMWRRRRMLGLAEKNIMNCEFDIVASDPSDANTNSTTLFSDDTDDKSHKNSNPEISLSIPPEAENNMITPAPSFFNTQPFNLSGNPPNVPEINEQHRGKVTFGPKKSELRIGQSSAFFTYVKSNTCRSSSITINEPNPPQLDNKLSPVNVSDTQGHHDLISGPSDPMNSKTFDLPEAQIHQPGSNYQHPDVSGYNAYSPYPYYLPGPMNLQNHYNHVMHCPPPLPHLPGMGSFPYYPVNLCLPGTNAMQQPWMGYGSPLNNVKVHNNNNSRLDRREAALMKFRQKRKERCFDKKIRYVNRKKLAERRPRVRGQFVRKINGINVDLNGQPTSTDFDDEDDDNDIDDEEDEEGRDSSPENNFSVFHN
ncbi:unnamed protein product [Lactuca saligna]|uniref:Uncharacterized protein n=1 Tax=Lactuca saligna TaxID=75948 RepID=A0AA35VU67_LACSI|nr:unnamed protein product [Lactuca saligna]